MVIGALRGIRWLDERFDVSETRSRAARADALALLPEEWTFRGHSNEARVIGGSMLAVGIVALMIGNGHLISFVVMGLTLGVAVKFLNREDDRAIASAEVGMRELVSRVDTATAERYYEAIGVIHGSSAEKRVREAVDGP